MQIKLNGEIFIVKKIANLANLNLSRDEEVKYAIQFSQILNYMEKIRQLKISKDIKPTSQVTNLENTTREDIVSPSLSQEDVFKNAKSVHDGFFKVKAILEE